MIVDLRQMARALGGPVLAPGPGHSRKDRSLSVRLSPAAPDGFLAFSPAGDDWRACGGYVRARFGLSREIAPRRPTNARRRSPEPQPEDNDHKRKIAAALALFREGVDPRGALAEVYLRSGGFDLAACPHLAETKVGRTSPPMLPA